MRILKLLIVIIIVSCSNKEQNLKKLDHVEVAKRYAEALYKKKDFKEASKYTNISIEDMQAATSLILPEPIKNYQFVLVKDSVIQNVAWIQYIELENSKANMKLLKIDHVWKVVYPERGEKSFFANKKRRMPIKRGGNK